MPIAGKIALSLNNIAISVQNLTKSKRSESGKKRKTLEVLKLQGFFGTPSGARTLDTLIKSQVLYQLS